MDPIWRCKEVSVKKRTMIYNQVIRAKLMYGLETCRYSDRMAINIDAFQKVKA